MSYPKVAKRTAQPNPPSKFEAWTSGSALTPFRRCDHGPHDIQSTHWWTCSGCGTYDLCNECASELKTSKSNQDQAVLTCPECEKPVLPVVYDLNTRTSLNDHETLKKLTRHFLNKSLNSNHKKMHDYHEWIIQHYLNGLSPKPPSEPIPSTTPASISTSPSSTDPVMNVDSLRELLREYRSEMESKQINILSLDGGGVRGYLTMKVLQLLFGHIAQDQNPEIAQLVNDMLRTQVPDSFNLPQDKSTWLDDLLKDMDPSKLLAAQRVMMYDFDYAAGTSTGGLLAFCLYSGVPLAEVMDIYRRFEYFFIPYVNVIQKVMTAGLRYPRYSIQRIHEQITQIIEKYLPVKVRTIGELHKYVNAQGYVTNTTTNPTTTPPTASAADHRKPPKERILLITTFDCTLNRSIVVASNEDQYAEYPIIDVLASTMAAPTYFPPYKPATNPNEPATNSDEPAPPHIYVDGGVFANNPELCAMIHARTKYSGHCQYRVIGIGTGMSNKPMAAHSGSVHGWLFSPPGLLVNTLMTANGSCTEMIASKLATYANIRRFKFNITAKREMQLDDPTFVTLCDEQFKYNQQIIDDVDALYLFYADTCVHTVKSLTHPQQKHQL